MSGIYGTIKPSNINPATDVEMYYYYRPTRNIESPDFSTFKTLDPASCLKKAENETGSLLGLYTLKLPVDKFNRKGFYSIYIKPKEIIIDSLYDVSVLAPYPNVRGIVMPISDLGGNAKDLSGYRIEYYDENGERTEVTRLITSSNYCLPVSVPTSIGYQNEIRYKLTDYSNYLFCTVTPSLSPSYNANALPFIGKKGGKISLTNTKFNPILIEVEMVDHDADTISYMLEGDQVRDRDNAIITTYNDEHEIYHQYDYYTNKDRLGNPLYDVKVKRENIDGNQTYNNVINGNA